MHSTDYNNHQLVLPSIRKEDVVGRVQLDSTAVVFDGVLKVLGGERLVSESARFGGYHMDRGTGEINE
jgi:hypothetical protein